MLVKALSPIVIQQERAQRAVTIPVAYMRKTVGRFFEMEECIVCFEWRRSNKYPCEHSVCYLCSSRLHTCPLCRADVWPSQKHRTTLSQQCLGIFSSDADIVCDSLLGIATVIECGSAPFVKYVAETVHHTKLHAALALLYTNARTQTVSDAVLFIIASLCSATIVLARSNEHRSSFIETGVVSHVLRNIDTTGKDAYYEFFLLYNISSDPMVLPYGQYIRVVLAPFVSTGDDFVDHIVETILTNVNLLC